MASANGFTVVLGPSVYMIVAPDGTEGGLTDYGETATIRVGGSTYMCHMDSPSDPAGVGLVTTIVPQVTLTEEDPELEAEEGDEDEDGEDDDDGEDNDDGKESPEEVIVEEEEEENGQAPA